MAGRVILLAGKIGSGKSTVAEHLIKAHNFYRVKIADGLKNMLRAFGLNDREIEGDLKDHPCDKLMGETPRWAMQTLGTEWGRKFFGEELWIKNTVDKIRSALFYNEDIVVDDLRFINELHYFRVNLPSTKAYRIHRPVIYNGYELPVAYEHPSEQEIDILDVDHVIFNDGSLDKLHSMTNQMVRAYV